MGNSATGLQNKDSVQTFAVNNFYFCHIGFQYLLIGDCVDAANGKVFNNSAMSQLDLISCPKILSAS